LHSARGDRIYTHSISNILRGANACVGTTSSLLLSNRRLLSNGSPLKLNGSIVCMEFWSRFL